MENMENTQGGTHIQSPLPDSVRRRNKVITAVIVAGGMFYVVYIGFLIYIVWAVLYSLKNM